MSVIYIGVDDSNHAGTDMKGEIILVTFSLNSENGVPRVHPNRRRIKPEAWLREGNEYRFTILTDPEFKRNNFNLVLAAPLIIKKYFEENPNLNPSRLSCSFDGLIDKCQEKFVAGDLIHICSDVSVRGYVKKGHRGKRMPTPTAVYAADNLANYYLKNKICIGRVLSDERMIALPIEELLEREKMLKARKTHYKVR